MQETQHTQQSNGSWSFVALVIVNKQMKFHKICLNTYKVIVKVKVCHDDNDYTEVNDDDDNTGVSPGSKLFDTQTTFSPTLSNIEAL